MDYYIENFTLTHHGRIPVTTFKLRYYSFSEISKRSEINVQVTEFLRRCVNETDFREYYFTYHKTRIGNYFAALRIITLNFPRLLTHLLETFAQPHYFVAHTNYDDPGKIDYHYYMKNGIHPHFFMGTYRGNIKTFLESADFELHGKGTWIHKTNTETSGSRNS